MTKMIILSTLVLFSSCRVPKLEPQVRLFYSVKFSECRCQWYDYMSRTGQGDPILCDEFHEKFFPEEPVKYQEDYCEGMIGNSPTVWGTKLKPWIFKLIETIKDMLD